MLVVVSDLHLTDGSSGETIRARAFRVFRERIRDLAYDASWRPNGKYKPIEELHIVLLGDILDVIRSCKWLSGKTSRPWGNPQTQTFAKKIQTITNAILEHNRESLAVLKSLENGKTITIPPATRDGGVATVSRDPKAKERVPVKVHIHYMVGNHDWFYHLPGTAYDQIRQRVINAIGLANPPGNPFPHDPFESPAILSLFEQHAMFGRHGDIFDPFNYDGDRNASSLGDAIVVDLLNRFPTEVKKKMGDELPRDCLEGLKEIDNVRPLLVIPIWVDGLLRRTCTNPAQIKRVKDIWDALADDFLNIPFVRGHNSVFKLFDSYDKLAWALKFSKGVSLHSASELLNWVNEKMTTSDDRFYQNAFTERAFKNLTARFIVYGHTHHYEIVPLNIAYVNRGLVEQMYMNSGTWRRVHELARLNPKDQEFIGYNVLTYFAFFKGDERGGRHFDLWSGALGI